MNKLTRPPIDWVVCAAGNGLRFKEKGLISKKPLIKLMGKSFIERSLESLDLLEQDKLIVLIQKDNFVYKEVEKVLSKFSWIDSIIVQVEGRTSGQLATFLHAKKYLRPNSSVVIWNCDTYFKSFSLNTLISSSCADAIVPCGKLAGSKWSFYKVDSLNTVIDVAEKKRISQNASVGFYYFRNSTQLLKIAKEVLALSPPNGVSEHFVSLVHNKMIDKGFKVVVCSVELFLPFGTVEDIKKYWGVSLNNLLDQNPIGTIVADLDGTITIDDKDKSYATKKPNQKVVKKLREYKTLGFKVIIQTARNMRTQLGDESLVIGNVGKDTILWLEKYNVPYDGLRFGKPFAENCFYIDDKAVRPSEFINTDYEHLMELLSHE
jgi:capsule biosynthesis phosphatase